MICGLNLALTGVGLNLDGLTSVICLILFLLLIGPKNSISGEVTSGPRWITQIHVICSIPLRKKKHVKGAKEFSFSYPAVVLWLRSSVH